MISRRKQPSENARQLAEGPKEAPEPKSPEERANEASQRRAVVASLTAFLLLAGLHVLAHVTWWAVLAVVVATAALNLRYLRSLPRARRPRTSPLRGLFLFSLAISVAVTVLVSISGYRSDLILIPIFWAISGVIWLADRGLVRLLRTR